MLAEERQKRLWPDLSLWRSPVGGPMDRALRSERSEGATSTARPAPL